MSEDMLDLDQLSLVDDTVDTTDRREVCVTRNSGGNLGFAYRMHKVLGHIVIDAVLVGGPCAGVIHPGESLLAVNGFGVSTMEDVRIATEHGGDAVLTVCPTERIALVAKFEGMNLGIAFSLKEYNFCYKSNSLWSSHLAPCISELSGAALLSGQLDKGDCIQAINGVAVNVVREVIELIEKAPAGSNVEFRIANGFGSPAALSRSQPPSPSNLSPSKRYGSPTSVWEQDPSALEETARLSDGLVWST